jgi:hypothetical protein
VQPNPRPRIRIAILALSLSLAAGIGAVGCSGSAGGLSGHYEADMGDGKITLDFSGSNHVNVSLVSGKDSLTHHCVYTRDGNKLVATTDEPMGVPMHLIVDGDVIRDDTGVVYKKK